MADIIDRWWCWPEDTLLLVLLFTIALISSMHLSMLLICSLMGGSYGTIVSTSMTSAMGLRILSLTVLSPKFTCRLITISLMAVNISIGWRNMSFSGLVMPSLSSSDWVKSTGWSFLTPVRGCGTCGEAWLSLVRAPGSAKVCGGGACCFCTWAESIYFACVHPIFGYVRRFFHHNDGIFDWFWIGWGCCVSCLTFFHRFLRSRGGDRHPRLWKCFFEC